MKRLNMRIFWNTLATNSSGKLAICIVCVLITNIFCISKTLAGQIADVDIAEKNTSVKADSSLPQCPELVVEDNTNLEMVNQILNEKKPYAALAFIESIHAKSPQLDLLKANSLRQIGKFTEAEAVYGTLKTSCVAAFAYQGLGLISHQHDLYQDAVMYFKVAANLSPINSTIRSDYGFALMSIGDYKASLNELLTAIELDERNVRAKYNLVALLYRSNQAEKAQQFVRKYNISEAEINKIQQDLQYSRSTVTDQAAAISAMQSNALRPIILQTDLPQNNKKITYADVEISGLTEAESDINVKKDVAKRTISRAVGNDATVCIGTSDICTGLFSIKMEQK